MDFEQLFTTDSVYVWTLGLLVLVLIVALARRGGGRRRASAPRGIKVGPLSDDWLSRHRDWRRKR